MIHVLSFISRLTPTSIPLEIAAAMDTETDIDVTVVSFYDNTPTTDYDVSVIALDAKSRFDVNAFQRLWRLLRQDSTDVLHTHHNFIGSVARVLGTFADVGIVNTEHRQHTSLTPLQNAVNAPTLPLADRIVTNSKATEQSFYWPDRLFLSTDQINMVYNGIDIDRIEAVMDIGTRPTDSDCPRILTVGRLVDVKNYDLLLKAFALVANWVPDAKLVLVGDGPRRASLESLVNRLGISERVRFLGEVSREEVYRQLAASDVFVVSSHAEGFCVAAVEAMACGLPVVASDIPVFHEVIGDCGRFADPEDPESFAQALSDLCTDEQMRTTLGNEAEERAKAVFPLERTVEQYYKIYKDIAATDEQ